MVNIPEFLKDYGELISITLIPFILWFLGIKFQDREAKKKAKLDLFLRLMADRKKIPISKDWADALNQIDVIFQDSNSVRSAWRAYYDSLHPKSQHSDSSNSFQLDLLSEIANDLGYKNLKQTEIDRYYSPQFFGDKVRQQESLLNELARVLANSKSFSEAFSEEDINQLKKT